VLDPGDDQFGSSAGKHRRLEDQTYEGRGAGDSQSMRGCGSPWRQVPRRVCVRPLRGHAAVDLVTSEAPTESWRSVLIGREEFHEPRPNGLWSLVFGLSLAIGPASIPKSCALNERSWTKRNILPCGGHPGVGCKIRLWSRCCATGQRQ